MLGFEATKGLTNMSGLLDGLIGQLGSGGVSQIAGALGVDDDKANSAIGMALPALLGGLANNAKSSGGAQSLSTALDGHDDSVFSNLGGLLGGGGDGSKILGHVLGNKQGSVEKNLAAQSGLDVGSISKLLPMLAPLVMGYLSKQKSSGGLDAGSLGSLLGNEKAAAEKKTPGLGGLSSILDADGDGSIMDDVIGMATGKSKGGIGGMLGKLFGR